MTQYLFMLTIFALTHVFGHCSFYDGFSSFTDCVSECDKDDGRYNSSGCILASDVFTCKCSEECKYDCLWPVVENLAELGWSIPKFNGKWPMKRLWGLEEPASVAFSLLNVLTDFAMFTGFKEEMCLSPSCKIWFPYTLVSANCWFWSAVFHSQDTIYTKLIFDISTFTMVLFTFYTIGFQILSYSIPVIQDIFSALCTFVFIFHSLYLLTTDYNYEYNLSMNLLICAGTGAVMIIWAFANRRKMDYCKYLIFYVLGMTLASLLKLIDFQPLFWTFDAHSLWLLAISPNAFFMYKFAIEDCFNQVLMVHEKRYREQKKHQLTLTIDQNINGKIFHSHIYVPLP